MNSTTRRLAAPVRLRARLFPSGNTATSAPHAAPVTGPSRRGWREGHQPRPHSGPHDSHTVNLARVATPCTDGPTRVVVGYEPGIPRIELRNELNPAKVDDTRVARVLQRAFPKPCYELEIKSLLREDLGQSVARGVVDVGVAGIVSA